MQEMDSDNEENLQPMPSMADILDEAMQAAEINHGRTGNMPPPPNPPPPPPVIPGSVKKSSIPASRLSLSIRVQREDEYKVINLGGASPVLTCGDFHTLNDGRLRGPHLVEDAHKFQLGSTSFVPTNWQCLACENHILLP